MTIEFRNAVQEDLTRIREIDELCFPEGSLIGERAHSGELEQGITTNQFILGVSEGEIVGALQYEFFRDHVYLVSLTVDPTFQRKGIGRRLIGELVRMLRTDHNIHSITTVTSPQNLPMMKLLFSQGFISTNLIPDYFGPGKDRIYCQRPMRLQQADADDMILIPVTSASYALELLQQENRAIIGIVSGVQGELFELAKFRADTPEDYRANEAAISVGEAGTVVAALTFLLGLSYGIPDYSEALRTVLLISTLLTIGSMQLYANSSGALARLREDSFDNHMKWGNLLLEFGGLYPLIIVLPVAFEHASSSTILSLATASVVTAVIVLYELSPFSVSARYGRDAVFFIFLVLLAGSPLAAIWLSALTGNHNLWAILLGVALLLRVLTFAQKSKKELTQRHRPRIPGLIRVPRKGRK